MSLLSGGEQALTAAAPLSFLPELEQLIAQRIAAARRTKPAATAGPYPTPSTLTTKGAFAPAAMTYAATSPPSSLSLIGSRKTF